MGWERRGEAGVFYYRATRDGEGRVVREYLGRGPRAEAAAAAVARRSAERESDRQAVREMAASLAGLDGLTEAIAEGAGVLLEAHLLARGYRRSNYGPWRKRRGHESITDAGRG